MAYIKLRAICLLGWSMLVAASPCVAAESPPATSDLTDYREEVRRGFGVDQRCSIGQVNELERAAFRMLQDDEKDTEKGIAWLSAWADYLRESGHCPQGLLAAVDCAEWRRSRLASLYERAVQLTKSNDVDVRTAARATLAQTRPGRGKEHDDDPWWALGPFMAQLSPAHQERLWLADVGDSIPLCMDVSGTRVLIAYSSGNRYNEILLIQVVLGENQKPTKVPLPDMPTDESMILKASMSGRNLLVCRDSGALLASAEFKSWRVLPECESCVLSALFPISDAVGSIDVIGPQCGVRRVLGSSGTWCDELFFGSSILAAAAAEDGKAVYFAAGNADGGVWRVRRDACELSRIDVHAVGEVSGIGIVPGGDRLIVRDKSDVRSVSLLKPEGMHTRVNRGGNDPDDVLSCSPNGKYVAISNEFCSIVIVDAVDLHTVAVLSGHQSGNIVGAWSANSDRFVTAADDGTIRVWRVPTQ